MPEKDRSSTRYIYYAEEQIYKSLPKMGNAASSDE